MSEYSASSITVLDGTEGIRKRPAMYIGDVGERGYHHLVYEVVDNSIDEALAGRCNEVSITLHTDNSIEIRDDGAGIPAEIHPKFGIPTFEVILTKIHSGGKFDDKAYQVSGGLHGVGLAAVCSLSSSFRVESYRDGKKYSQDYSCGKPASKMVEEPIGEEKNGTMIRFTPDNTIFSVNSFDFETLDGRFREQAYLTPRFRINLIDERELTEENDYKSTSYYSEGGLVEFIGDSIGKKNVLVPDTPIFYCMAEIERVQVEVALTYTDSYQESLRGFVNNINTHEGGTHITGLRRVLTLVINDFAKEYKLLKEKDSNLSGNDVREGIIAIVSVKIPDPLFEGQTKTKLGNSEVDGYVSSSVAQPLKNWLVNNSVIGKAIIQKAILAGKAREAAKKAKDLIRKKSNSRLPGKLVSSREKDPMKRELYLVEGQSAGGTAVKARDAQFQEILFLRGKVLNVEKARLDRALENQEIRNIITAIGAGINEEFDLTKCRYGKVILLTDADVDGAHIATLLFTFFYRYMKPLIEDGRLYIARPPLFRINFPSKISKMIDNQKFVYAKNDEDLERTLTALEVMDIKRVDLAINRFKGLGEMNASQLEETAMAKTRNIDRVNINNDMQSEDWLVRLMGDDVAPRKEYISNGVFEEEGLESRGKFYEIAFDETIDMEFDEIYNKVIEEIEKRSIEFDLDQSSEEEEFLRALEALEF